MTDDDDGRKRRQEEEGEERKKVRAELVILEGLSNSTYPRLTSVLP